MGLVAGPNRVDLCFGQWKKGRVEYTGAMFNLLACPPKLTNNLRVRKVHTVGKWNSARKGKGSKADRTRAGRMILGRSKASSEPRSQADLRCLLLVASAMIWSLLLSINAPSAVAADDQLCLQQGGSHSAAVTACNRALEGWFISDINRRALRIARARHNIESGNTAEAQQDLQQVATQARNAISRIEQDAHNCKFKWSCQSSGEALDYDTIQAQYRSAVDLLAASQSATRRSDADAAEKAAAAEHLAAERRNAERARAAAAAKMAEELAAEEERAAAAAEQAAQAAEARRARAEAERVAAEQQRVKAAAAVKMAEQLAAADERQAAEQERLAKAAQQTAQEVEPPRAKAELEPPRTESPVDQRQDAGDLPFGGGARREPMQPVVAPAGVAAAALQAGAGAIDEIQQASDQSGPSRIALVIGNSGYHHAPRLANPRNDAADVAALLARMGFTVLDGTDLGRDAMEDLMIRFAKAASKAEVAVAFYAGHGIQVEGTNYLIPVDAAIKDEFDLRRLIRLDDMVRDTGRADRFGLVMVDACRDNPFEAVLARSLGSTSRSAGSAARGLAAPVVPPRVLVAYATGATQTAADGDGRNSPFTTAVLEHLAEPDDVRIVVGKIIDTVAKTSQQRQRPDYWGSLGGERIFLVEPEAVAEALDNELTLLERQAVQRALARIGLYAGADDGRFSLAVRRAIREFQTRSGATPNGYLSVDQLVALYDEARYGGTPAPLPPIDIIDLLRRSEAGEKDAALLRARLFDRAYVAGPLPKDMTEAARWYRKAADAGQADAALALGRMFRDGNGIEADPVQAARWLKAAADAGSPEAQYDLARLYAGGSGVPGDRAEAIRLYRLAAAGQSAEAVAQLRALGAWSAP